MLTIPTRPLSLRDQAAAARRTARSGDPALRSLGHLSSGASARMPNRVGTTPAQADESARQQFIRQSVQEQNDAESVDVKARRIGSQWSEFFDQMKATEAAAAWEGKGFRADLSGIGQSSRSGSGGSMPQRRRSDPLDGLSGSGGGRFNVSDDPRVQQALVRQALDALNPMNESAQRGQEMQDSALEQNASEQRSLRSARDYKMPMNRIAQEMGDFNSESEARREFLPYRSGVNQQKFDRNLQLSTEPARIAAEGRRDVADITGDSRVDVANARKPDPIELLIDALGQTSKGAFGVDADGRPTSPPDDLRQRLRDALMGQTAPSGPAPARGAGAGRSGGAGPSTSVSGTPPSNPKPGDKYRMPNGKIAVWANDDGTWDWYQEDDGG